MKILYATLLALLLCLSSTMTNANPDSPQNIYPLIQGTYTIVGKADKSETAYTGTAEINTENGLKITRTVNGVTTVGTAQINKNEGGPLTLNVTYDGKDPDIKLARYHLFIDPDNYPILTGIVMKSVNEEGMPTREAFFFNNEPFE